MVLGCKVSGHRCRRRPRPCFNGRRTLDGSPNVRFASPHLVLGGHSEPSPLDALIASHIYPLTTLPETFKLRQTVDTELELKVYVERVMELAGNKVRGHVRR